MRKTLFAFFSFVVVVLSFYSTAQAANFGMKCELINLEKIDVFLNAELNLLENPILHYEEASRGWALQIGDVILDSHLSDIRKRMTRSSVMQRKIVIWVRGVQTYELEVDLNSRYAQLYWWGTVKKSLIADFSCKFK